MNFDLLVTDAGGSIRGESTTIATGVDFHFHAHLGGWTWGVGLEEGCRDEVDVMR